MFASEIAAVAGSFATLVGAPLEDSRQPARDRVFLRIGRSWWVFVPRGPDARFHSVERAPKNPQHPFSFQGALRSRAGARLQEVSVTPGERAVALVFSTFTLHLRLTGRSGGLYLEDAGRLVAAFDGPAPAALPPFPEHVPSPAPPRFAPEAGETWDLAARRFFEAAEAARQLTQRRVTVARALATQQQRDLRLRDGLYRDLDRASAAPGLRRRADALAAALWSLPKGATHASVPDLLDPEIVHEVPLDKKLPPSRILADLYAKVKRLERAGDHVLQHLDRVEDRLQRLERARVEVQSADAEGLEGLAALCAPARAARRADSQTLPYDLWIGPGGRRVLIGRNADSNRRLCFQVAKGGDVWLHLRDRPSAHAIVPVQRGHSAPLEHLLVAAQLLIADARLADGEAADVQYAFARNLRPVPGAPGRVLVSDERVLHVRRDAAALKDWALAAVAG